MKQFLHYFTKIISFNTYFFNFRANYVVNILILWPVSEFLPGKDLNLGHVFIIKSSTLWLKDNFMAILIYQHAFAFTEVKGKVKLFYSQFYR